MPIPKTKQHLAETTQVKTKCRYIAGHLKKLIVVLAAIFGYGGWALYSNMADSADAQMTAWRAACIQGGYAGLLTFINISMLEFIYRRIAVHFAEPLSVALTVIAATLAQYSVIIPVHAYNDTPNIILTLLPGFVIGTVFSAAYLIGVIKNKR